MKIIDAQVHIWAKLVMPPSGLHRKVEHFTADVASDTPDAQPAEAGVDVRGVGA